MVIAPDSGIRRYPGLVLGMTGFFHNRLHASLTLQFFAYSLILKNHI